MSIQQYILNNYYVLIIIYSVSMASNRTVGFNTESVTSLVDIGTLILKSSISVL